MRQVILFGIVVWAVGQSLRPRRTSVGEYSQTTPKLLLLLVIIVFRKIDRFRFHGQRDAHNSG